MPAAPRPRPALVLVAWRPGRLATWSPGDLPAHCTAPEQVPEKPRLLVADVPAEMREALERAEREGRGVLLLPGELEAVQLSPRLLEQLRPSILSAERKAIVIVVASPQTVDVGLHDAQDIVDGAPPAADGGFGGEVARAVETFDRETEVPCLLTDTDTHSFLFMQQL